ncbi:hypothetical protein BDN72DRAFT_960972 [Pluteus cervinus]|uniref:Uncharacterized protein n=1 Tax=Pluteus cervinus TaxID=181527 RepID=A0ACD3AR88_9AGAR|nr:hypothetical protein BDN72DRAFT_960972 [Pluteus cervinus]
MLHLASCSGPTGETPRMFGAQRLSHLSPTLNFSLLVCLWMSCSQAVVLWMCVGDVGDTFGLHICGLIGMKQTQEHQEGQEEDGQQQGTRSRLSSTLGNKAGGLNFRCGASSHDGLDPGAVRDQCTLGSLLEKAEKEKKEAEEDKARGNSKEILVGLVLLCKTPGSPGPKSHKITCARGGCSSESTTPQSPQRSPISLLYQPYRHLVTRVHPSIFHQRWTERPVLIHLIVQFKVDWRGLHITFKVRRPVPHRTYVRPQDLGHISPLQPPPLSGLAVQSTGVGVSPTRTCQVPKRDAQEVGWHFLRRLTNLTSQWLFVLLSCHVRHE